MKGPGRFAYITCPSCGAAYLENPPAPESLGAYYPRGYIRSGQRAEAIRRVLSRLDLGPKVRLTAAQPGRRLLDIGCARGDFLLAMRDRGWIVAGVEPTEWLADRALAQGLPVWAATLDLAPLPTGAFDVATLWDVLEHLPDPGAGLRRVRAALRPQGRVIVNTPVTDGWDARLFGGRWSGWDAPRHHVVFSRPSLDLVLENAGFRPVATARVFETYLITALTLGLMARERWPRLPAAVAWGVLHARITRLAMAGPWRLADRVLGPSSVAVVAERV